jgi:hypothetical protein
MDIPLNQMTGWCEMGGAGHSINFSDLEQQEEVMIRRTAYIFAVRLTDLDAYFYGYWIFLDDAEASQASNLGHPTADSAIAHVALDWNNPAGGLLVTWMPGHLDGTQGIGNATIKQHIKTIYKRRSHINTKYGQRDWPSLGDDPHFGYRKTDPV